MHVTTLGDVMLDVLVATAADLRHDDDIDAAIQLVPGGQAANVAAWVVEVGGSATLIGPKADDPAGQLVAAALAGLGVEFAAVSVDATGIVVSIVSPGSRTMASDSGDQSWLGRIETSVLPSQTDWLHVSAYPLLRASDLSPVLELVQRARDGGASVSLDCSAAALVETYGDASFRALVADLQPDVVFANQAEWHATGLALDRVAFSVVLKRGAEGVRIRTSEAVTDYPALSSSVLDTTGAGDALAAGYLVGGPSLALQAAAHCVAQTGAQPHRADQR